MHRGAAKNDARMGSIMTNTAALQAIARQMLSPGRGILAADESTSTIEKRFAKIHVPSTEENRRAYREMLFTTEGLGTYISGVILYDETLRQSASDGKTFVRVLEEGGMLPGIKVDQGLEPLYEGSEEKVTKGLFGLPERLKEYVELGAKFAKWRAVIIIGAGMPTDACIRENAKRLAQYAKQSQNVGLVPIVEPEVLMDGRHSAALCEETSEKTLRAVFEELARAGVALEGMVLKTNMVVPGKESGESMSPAQVAEATLRVFNRVLPENLAGQAFLSGGQSEIEATENLNAMYMNGTPKWPLTFSYGRALQDSALKTWAGKKENVVAAQAVLLHRAKMNALAAKGMYSPEAENA